MGIEIETDVRGRSQIVDPRAKFTCTNTDAEHPAPKVYEAATFFEGKEGSIEIVISDIRGQVTMLDVSKSTQRLKTVTRLAPHLVKGSKKYDFPAGDGIQTFYPPNLQKAFAESTPIETLILTEGAFKAMQGALAGLYVVGLGSITHYREGDGIVVGIREIIERCDVQNVVILWDADAYDISEKAVGNMLEDAAARPSRFFSAACKIRSLLKEIALPDERQLQIWFKTVRMDVYVTKPKGLDDLIQETMSSELDALVAELNRCKNGGAERFFTRRNITGSTARLKKDFALEDVNAFYTRHCDFLGEHEFLFFGDRYQANAEGEVEMRSPEWAENHRWIGDEFFAIEDVPGAGGKSQRKLLKRDQSTMKVRFGKDFHQYLQFYKGFCCVPDHFNFKQEVDGFYNRYFPLLWKPVEGEIPTITAFYKHIFGDREITMRDGTTVKEWELGMDYTQLLLTNPTQPLPVICLYSQENATGKSTFSRFHEWVFGENVVGISNADLRSDFNETFADKLLAYCDETLLERKKDAEIIKSLSDRKTIVVNPKGQRQYTIPFFCHFIFASNNRRMIYMTEQDERYWVLKVRKPKASDPDLENKLKKEIPAFLHYLQTRQLKASRESRMWFHPDYYRGPAFREFVGDNMPGDAAQIKETICEMMVDFKRDKIEMPLANIIKEAFGGKKDKRWVKEILADHLKVDLLRDVAGRAKQIRGTYPVWRYTEDGEQIESIESFNGRPYVFYAADMLDDDQRSVVYEADAKGLADADATDENPPAPDGSDLPF